MMIENSTEGIFSVWNTVVIVNMWTQIRQHVHNGLQMRQFWDNVVFTLTAQSVGYDR